IQPEEGITLRFGAKVPVPGVRIRPVSMDFLYGAAFAQESPDAYERLILDAMLGDATLFPRYDEVEEAWEVVEPILENFASERPGDVIRTEVVPSSAGVKVWRVLYRSTGVTDKPVAVSGLILAPSSPPPSGGFPVVAYAHGTTGIADACAPSKSDEAVRLLSL